MRVVAVGARRDLPAVASNIFDRYPVNSRDRKPVIVTSESSPFTWMDAAFKEMGMT
jgi:hypothetical protein